MKILDLYITKVCNLNCEYCYVDLVKSEKTFNTNLVTKRIKLLDYDHIKFFGGEPLLKFQEIREIVLALMENKKEVKFSIVTNGLLLDSKKLDFCRKYQIETIISIHKKGIIKLLPYFKNFIINTNLIGFNFIFEANNINFPRQVIPKLIHLGFSNFTLTPEIYSNWDSDNIKALKEELNFFIKLASKYPQIHLKGIDGNYLKTPVVGCEKVIMNTDAAILPCNRFKKVDILSTFNYSEIHNIFDSEIGYSKDKNRWFYVCPIGWFLDHINTDQNIKNKIKQYQVLNSEFIHFFKSLNKLHGYTNFLSDGIEEIRFNLTSQCNIRCEYCYVDFKNQSLSERTAKNIIDFYLAQDGNEKIISFFGGEPLLEFPLLEKLVSYAQERAIESSKKIRFIIATNYLLVNQKIADFFKKYGFEIHVSCNGIDEINNITRDNSSNRLWSNLYSFKNTIPLDSITILLAFSQKHVDSLYKNIKYISNLGIKRVNLEIITNHGEYAWTREGILKLKYQLMALRKSNLEIHVLNLYKERKFIDVSVQGEASQNSFDFHKYHYDFKIKKIFDHLVRKILKK